MTARDFEEDVIQTCEGELTITFIGHGTLMFAFGDLVVHVDPVMDEADYSAMPEGDTILVTHEHFDHLDAKAIELVRGPGTTVIVSASCASAVAGATVMANGDVCEVDGLKIEAVPAYNIVNLCSPGRPFHPHGVGNGYIITFGDKRVYIAADTENTPEMKVLEAIDIAFLPMNLPYTMTPEMVADAARAFRPKRLYPYHYGSTDVAELTALLADEPDIEVCIRRMQ